MDNEKIKTAFFKIKEEMSDLNSELIKLKKAKPQKIVETKKEDTSKFEEIVAVNEKTVEKLTQKIGILEMGLNSLEQSTIETIKRIREEFDQKLQDEISSIRLELMDVVMKKQQSSTSAFEEELRNTYN